MPRHVHLVGDRMPLAGAHHTPALSPSRLALYRECPALYKRRYVDGIADAPTIDQEYGQAIHRGLEAHFLNEDAELVFLRELKQRLAPLQLAGADPAAWLVPQGLHLIQEARKLGYRGQPERKFIFAYANFRVPFRGIIDLWMPDRQTVIDWKTTRREWSEKTAEGYALQRAIYSQAIVSEVHYVPAFSFVALGAYPGGRVQVVESTPTPVELEETFWKIHALYLGIEAENWTCSCRNKQHEESAA